MRFPRSALGLLVVLSAVAAGSAVRIRVAFADPSFDAANPEGLLKSDPALLYYLVSRVVEAGGLPPADFRADPRIEHPDLVDVPATFAVGQEFAIAAAYRLAGGDLPLHAFCVVAMGIAASLAAAGVYGLALALTRSPGGAALATLLFVLLPANYRTIGFVLVREDLAFPAFALHLGLLAGAARVRTSLSFFAAGASLAVALATWHATVFFASLEAAILFAWFLRTGRDPFAVPRAWILPATAALFSLTIPVLSAKGAIVSPPMLLAGALLGASALRRVGGRRRWPRLGTAREAGQAPLRR